MNIGLTYDLKEDWIKTSDDPTDVNAEFDKPQTVDLLIVALESGNHTVTRIGNVENLIKQIDDLDVDIVFNVCEGRCGRNRESEVPTLLEMKGIPFVGSDALTLGMTLDKIIAKKIFISQGIPTPRYFIGEEDDDLEILNDIGFPLIVKTRHEGSSKGISDASLVKDFDALVKQVSFINNTYKQEALVEQYISGTEYTVAVLGNGDDICAMPVVQTTINGEKDLGDLIYTNERIYDKSIAYLCPAPIDEKLTKKIQALAMSVYKAVECRDFGRIDFRVSEERQPYALEINPLPSFDVEDVFHLFPKVFDSTFNETVNVVLNFALKRHGLISDFPIYYQKGANV